MNDSSTTEQWQASPRVYCIATFLTDIEINILFIPVYWHTVINIEMNWMYDGNVEKKTSYHFVQNINLPKNEGNEKWSFWFFLKMQLQNNVYELVLLKLKL